MISAAPEWAEVAPRRVLVATPGRAWLHAPAISGDPFAEPMQGPGSAETTRALLDAALGLALRSAPPRPPVRLDPARWAFRLIGWFHSASATPERMREAAARMRAAGRSALADRALAIAREESGHGALALRDLEALGFDAGALVAAHCPPSVRALLDAFAALVARDEPVECFGYAYALERRASRVPEAEIAALEASLPVGRLATRCLRVHSAVGADADHVRASIETISGLPAADRVRIVRACFEIGLVLARRLPDDDPSNAALAELLSPFRRHPGAA
jgi:hypothetical protein